MVASWAGLYPGKNLAAGGGDSAALRYQLLPPRAPAAHRRLLLSCYRRARHCYIQSLVWRGSKALAALPLNFLFSGLLESCFCPRSCSSMSESFDSLWSLSRLSTRQRLHSAATDSARLILTTVVCKETRLFGIFPYKLYIFATLEIFMITSPFKYV